MAPPWSLGYELWFYATLFLFTDGETEAQRCKDPWPRPPDSQLKFPCPRPTPASTEERPPNWDVA